MHRSHLLGLSGRAGPQSRSRTRANHRVGHRRVPAGFGEPAGEGRPGTGGSRRPEAGADPRPVRLRCFVSGIGAPRGASPRHLGRATDRRSARSRFWPDLTAIRSLVCESVGHMRDDLGLSWEKFCKDYADLCRSHADPLIREYDASATLTSALGNRPRLVQKLPTNCLSGRYRCPRNPYSRHF